MDYFLKILEYRTDIFHKSYFNNYFLKIINNIPLSL